MRIRHSFIAAAIVALGASACAPADDAASETKASDDTCKPGELPTLTDGTLTIGTDSPAYDPWFAEDDPTNGKGFESAVAYAVADELGYAKDQVEWKTVRFNNSFRPGEKDFDFDINQISITPKREKVVDFSDGYYSAAQAVIALKGSDAAKAESLDALQDFQLGAQTGTTSLTAVRDQIEPGDDPLVFADTNAAKQALLNKQTDAIVADLPTAFYIVSAEIPEAEIMGQFQPTTGETEEFGMLFEKGSPLVGCVNDALATLRDNGSMDELEATWLSDAVGVPEIQ